MGLPLIKLIFIDLFLLFFPINLGTETNHSQTYISFAISYSTEVIYSFNLGTELFYKSKNKRK